MTTNSDYAALLLRLTSGVLFIAHGLMKVFVFTIPGTVGYFESLGLPGALAYLTIFAEVAGGLALIAALGNLKRETLNYNFAQMESVWDAYRVYAGKT